MPVIPQQVLKALPTYHPTVNIDTDDLTAYWWTSLTSEVNRGTLPANNLTVVNYGGDGAANGLQLAVSNATAGLMWFRQRVSSAWGAWTALPGSGSGGSGDTVATNLFMYQNFT